jgi:hypothetical protein
MEKDKYRIERVDKATCKDFLLKHHYLSRQGYGFRCGFNYGLFIDHMLIGVAIFHGISAGETVVGCFGLTKNDQAGFFELGRLAMDPEHKVKNLTSWFLSKAMKQFRVDTRPRAIISYADAAYHHGYIYQACNFTYHGLTAKKTDAWVKQSDGTFKKCGRGRPRGDGVVVEWRPRTQKHRYLKVYDKKLCTQWPQMPYPKGNNSEY